MVNEGVDLASTVGVSGIPRSISTECQPHDSLIEWAHFFSYYSGYCYTADSTCKGSDRILSIHKFLCLVHELLEGRVGYVGNLLDQIPSRKAARTMLSSWSSTESFSLLNLAMKSLSASILPCLRVRR